MKSSKRHLSSPYSDAPAVTLCGLQSMDDDVLAKRSQFGYWVVYRGKLEEITCKRCIRKAYETIT